MKYLFKFVKYQGCGNDFILRDEIKHRVTPDSDRGKMSKILCDRHFGIGADGILFIERAKGVDGFMRLFERDGEEADMCGNGIRCVGAYLMEQTGKSETNVLTRDGVKKISRIGNEYRVQMGAVRTRRQDLAKYLTDKSEGSDTLLDLTVSAGERVIRGSLVNTGEPHLVFHSEDVAGVDLVGIAEKINDDGTRFPTGVNVNFMQVLGPHEIKNRTYERGVCAETMACGTGATASTAVALLLHLVEQGPVKVVTHGGRLTVEIDDEGYALMTGPAVPVFEGKMTLVL